MCAGIFMSALHMLSLVLVGCYKSTPYKYEEYNSGKILYDISYACVSWSLNPQSVTKIDS